MSNDIKRPCEPLESAGGLREAAGRMYEASDILRAIKSQQYASQDDLVKALEQRCAHLSGELTKSC